MSCSQLLQSMREGSILLICSTIEPPLALELTSLAAARGLLTLDCPVSGAKEKALSGTLTIMVGGDPAVVEECRPILNMLGEKVFHVGPAGKGAATKLINNLLNLMQIAGVLEARRLAASAGMDIDQLLEIINVSTGASWVTQNWEVASSWVDGYKPGGTLDLTYKDIGLTLSWAGELKVPLPMAGLAQQLGVSRGKRSTS